MNSSYRLRLLNVLSRQTRMRMDADMLKLKSAVDHQAESSRHFEDAETRAAAALKEIQRQSAPGQPIDVEALRNGASYRHDCVEKLLAARQQLNAIEAVVRERRGEVMCHRVRLDKLDERQQDELHRLAVYREVQDQKEVDETWVLGHSQGAPR